MKSISLPRIKEPQGTGIQRALDFLSTAVNEILATFISRDSSLIFSATLSASATPIQHRIGAIPTGYVILYKSANEDVWCTGLDSSNITLTASGAVNVKILVIP